MFLLLCNQCEVKFGSSVFVNYYMSCVKLRAFTVLGVVIVVYKYNYNVAMAWGMGLSKTREF